VTSTSTPTGTAHRTPHPHPRPVAEQSRRGARDRAREISGLGSGRQEGPEEVRRELPAWLIKAVEKVRAYAFGDIPTVWSEPPATLASLLVYARHGAWVGPGSKFWRALGVLWCALIAIPVSTLAYYLAWFCQRPGRLITGVVVAVALWHVW
jgi:hypothetical protein